MAVARPVRFLGALSVVLFFFLVFQYLRPTPRLAPPAGEVVGNGEKIDDMERDPLLDRKSYLFKKTNVPDAESKQQSANPTACYGDTPNTTTRPRRAPPGSTPPSCRWCGTKS
jgi:hypothetical protein